MTANDDNAVQDQCAHTNNKNCKRTRLHSPVAEPKKAELPTPSEEETSADLPPIPHAILKEDDELPNPVESQLEPDEYLKALVKAQYGVTLKFKSGLELGEDYFKPVTEEQNAAYTMEVLTPARDNNVEALRVLVRENGRQAVDCVNRFGESLLNLACRRGFVETAELLLSDEVDLDVRSKDDFGRTALHDAMWNPKPQLEICRWLIAREPSLLLVTDKRGNTPFQYARAEDYNVWRKFLFDNRSSLQGLTKPETLKRFC